MKNINLPYNTEYLCKECKNLLAGSAFWDSEEEGVCGACYREKPKCKFGRHFILSEIKDLIVDEMLICYKDGTPTNRLISLFNKVDDLLKK